LPLRAPIEKVGARPPASTDRAGKKRYSELVSNAMALTVAGELTKRGLEGVMPSGSRKGSKGAERRIAGGLGDKKVDVTYATERSGLILAVSIKTISFPDEKTKNYQKNLQNRKGDMVFEVTTLHKRFPYAVVGGLFFLYEDAREDNVGRARISTFDRAHQVFKVFNHRIDQRDEESKFEYLAIGLYHSTPARFSLSEAGVPTSEVSFDEFISALPMRVAERNPENYVYYKDKIWKPSELGLNSEK
jgi:hypothetical protein